jgi:hypothetical protein
MNAQPQLNISELKPLNTSQYDLCRQTALRRVQSRIGNRPQRRAFERELGPIATPLDFIALIVFAAALVISSLHIIVHMGTLATTSYTSLSQSTTGTSITADLYAAAHQWGAIFMAEGSMILFAALFGLTKKTWRRWVFFTLALLAALFVIIANWQSNVGALESIMPAIFTLGLGLNLERLIVATLKRREDVNERYLAALVIWETASTDASKHPDYLPMLRQEIWQKLTSLKANQAFIEAPAALRHQAVARELERDLWAFDTDTPAPQLPPVAVPYIASPTETQEAITVAEHPLAFSTNGNGRIHSGE